jgi:hypothetical protein
VRLYQLTGAEVDDLVRALQEAQSELHCGAGFPEANAQFERWQRLVEGLGGGDFYPDGDFYPNIKATTYP